VTTSTGKQMQVSMSPDDSVASLKQEIEIHHGIAVAQQK
jgi:hypothetical protein